VKIRSAIGLLCRLYLGGLFVYAAWHKILDPAAFALDVATYQIVPLSLVNLAAIALPWLELVSGVMLSLGIRTRAAALLISGMMVVFTAALGVALARGLDLSCGCFASQSSADPISRWTLLRDAAWLGLSFLVLLFDRRPLGLDRLLQGGTHETA
jgi:putative oxidoreductase